VQFLLYVIYNNACAYKNIVIKEKAFIRAIVTF